MEQRRMSEADWRYLRRLEPQLQERFGERALAEVARATESKTSPHERFHEVVRVVQESERAWERVFADPRRSVAFVRLAAIRDLGLLTDEEFAGFAEESRAAVAVLLELWES